MEMPTFRPETVEALLKIIWEQDDCEDLAKRGTEEAAPPEQDEGAQKKRKATTMTIAHPATLLACELLRLFIHEGVKSAADIAEPEGALVISPSHMTRSQATFLLRL